ncbi:MAG: BACON domain-containing protein, partial [Prevotellaceae bacterium]|nr:BACON domain-containing protein [Prevotellaceae bacterium]
MRRIKKLQHAFLLPLWGLGGFFLLMACKEEKEEPIYFETTAPAAYTFPETAASATFTVSSNTAWTVEVAEGSDRCSVAPASGKGNATVTVHVTANPFYLQSAMELLITAGDYTRQVAITQDAPPCPGFNPGAIATAGQTVTVGGTPATINSVQNATGGDGQISYQWYRNGSPISGATAASYTPPPSDADAAGTHTYTRRAKDNVCNSTFTPSTGNWVLTVRCPSFSSGTIATAGQTVTIGGTPITINSVQNASSENGNISYRWYRNGSAISGATAASYTPPASAATVAGVYTYTRSAKDNVCNTTFTPSAGSWVLTVNCPSFTSGAIATTGQTIFVGGTPATIESITNATSENGSISYQWYKNGNAISGATAA